MPLALAVGYQGHADQVGFTEEALTLTWLNHLASTLAGRLLFLPTLWLLCYSWREWKQLQTWERRNQRFLERQRWAQQRAQHALPGLPRSPECSACQAGLAQPSLAVPTLTPFRIKSNARGRPRHVQSTWQTCLFEPAPITAGQG